MRRLALMLALTLLAAPAGAAGQGVEATTLTAPDIFSGGSTATGLGPDLWRTSSAQIVRALIPAIDPAKLTPAGKALAVRLLSTSANAPAGAGNDRALAAARARALIGLEAWPAANASVERIPNLTADPGLAQVAADAALLTDNDDQACRVERAMTTARDDIYWMRLRAFCQALAGEMEAARLSLSLATDKARDANFSRLMNALVAATPAGEANRSTPLMVAMSRRLNIIQPTEPVAPAVFPAGLDQTDPVGAARLLLTAGRLEDARRLRATMTQDQIPGAQPGDLDLLDAAIAAATGQGRETVLGALVGRGAVGNRSAQLAALYLSALGSQMDADARAAFSGFDLGKSGASANRVVFLDLAAQSGAKGETGLFALMVAQSAGKEGLLPLDRAAIVRALVRAGLETDARAFAVEGILAIPRR